VTRIIYNIYGIVSKNNPGKHTKIRHFFHSPSSIRHSPSAIRHMPFAISHSPFANRHSPFAMHHVLFQLVGECLHMSLVKKCHEKILSVAQIESTIKYMKTIESEAKV
jgi:hypothetical protein